MKCNGEYWLVISKAGRKLSVQLVVRGAVAQEILEEMAASSPKVTAEPRLQCMVEELDEVVANLKMHPEYSNNLNERSVGFVHAVTRVQLVANKYRTDDMVGD